MKFKKPQKGSIPIIIMFLLGLGIALYPLVSQLYYYRISQQIVEQFDAEKEKLPSEEVKRRMELAHAYNDTIDPSRIADPYTKEEEEGRAEYARMLELKEQIGHIKIPKIVVDIPIYAGTSSDILEKGAGHLEGTSLPVGGNNTHTVITAHRGLPQNRLFTDLDKLEVGDRFYIVNLQGTMAYQINQIQVVEPTNFDPILISPGHDYATLLTCTPYMINSHRLLVRGHRVEYTEAMEEQEMEDNKTNRIYQVLFFITLAILLFILYKRYRRNKLEKLEASKDNVIENSISEEEEKSDSKDTEKKIE